MKYTTGLIGTVLSLAVFASASPLTTRQASSIPRLGGVNIAGFDFGIDTNGGSSGGYVPPPTSQFAHFQSKGANIFRVPVGWQYLQPSLGGSLDSNFLSQYQNTVNVALATGAYVIVDVHNYARRDGGIIGQGGPSNDQFANLWSQLASTFNNPKIIYGIMNEPHDLDMTQWAQSVQAAVNAIRSAGSTSQYILMPGTNYASVDQFQQNSGQYLQVVTDPAHSGSTDYLLYDVHRYLDANYAGQLQECVRDDVAVFTAFADYLNQNNRYGILSETGGGNTQSCVQYLGNALSYVKSAYPHFLGFTTWAAGSFDTSYNLTETPNADGSDQLIFTGAVQPNLP